MPRAETDGKRLIHATRREAMPSRFQVGDTVQVKVRGPEGYNRTPIYIRGKTGVIHSIHGEFVNARGLGYG